MSTSESDRPTPLPEQIEPGSARAPLARVLPMAPHAAKRAREARAARNAGGLSLRSRWALAALIVVGLAVAFEWGHRTLAPALSARPDARSIDVLRSGELRLEAPVGILELTGVESLPPFAWRTFPGALSYRVEVRDLAGALLWQATTAATTLPVPSELQTKLETRVTYRWNVIAFDAAQSAVGQSSPASFRVEPPAN